MRSRISSVMGVQSIGVCFLWSIMNGGHERRVAEIIRGEWPGVPVTLSHELNPIPREYRRAISAVIDASLRPIVSAYVEVLSSALRGHGYRHELLMANCVGGMMPPDEMIRKPIYSVMSGPTLAPIAATHLTDEPNVIVGDMGGTTFDVSAIRDGQLVVTPEAMLGKDLLGIPKVDVRSIGAGGGSIAWVDIGGLLRVGPQSAGARPGPACYGLGGEAPTVTDANVILGIIDPDYFLGGRIKLDRAAAEKAVGEHRRAARHRPGGCGLRHSHHQQPQHDHRDRRHHRARRHQSARQLPGLWRRRHRLPHRRDGGGARHRPCDGAEILSRSQRARRPDLRYPLRGECHLAHRRSPLRSRRRQPRLGAPARARPRVPRAGRRAGEPTVASSTSISAVTSISLGRSRCPSSSPKAV